MQITTSGVDSAHNPLIIRLSGNSLEIIGYFDYNKFNGYKKDGGTGDLVPATHRLIAGLHFSVSEVYGMWYANETDQTIGTNAETATGASKTAYFFSDYTGKNVKESILYFYDNTPSSSTNSSAALDPNNHIITLKAKTSRASILNVDQKFYTIKNDVVEQVANAETPIVPMTLVFNTTYYGTGGSGTDTGSLPTNGIIYYDRTNVETNNRTVSYKFGGASVPGRTMLSVAVSEDYRFVKYSNRYYMFVGFTTGTASETKTENVYQFLSEPPGGQLTAVFVEIQLIEIKLTSGGSYQSSVTNATLASDSVLNVLSSSISIGAANRFMDITMGASSFNATENTVKFNYVIIDSDISINPVESSGYTINKATYNDGSNTVTIPKAGQKLTITAATPTNTVTTSAVPSGSQPYTIIIKNYRDKYTFDYAFSSAYVVTIKQYLMSSMSSSASAKLYTDRVYTIIRDADMQLDDTDNDGVRDLTYLESQSDSFFHYNTHAIDYMTESYSLGEGFYIYFFSQAATTVIGFYENGRALVDAVTNSDLFEPAFTAHIGGGDYKVYKIFYPDTNEDAGVLQDLSLEVRFSTSIAVKTQVDGLTAKKVNGNTVYPYKEVFSDSMIDNHGEYLMAQYAGADGQIRHTIPLSEVASDTTSITAGASIQYLVETTSNTEYAFVRYYYNQRYPAAEVAENGDIYYRFTYNGETCYYYPDSYSDESLRRKIYTARRQQVNIDFSFDSTNKVILVEEFISDNEQANIQIDTSMIGHIDPTTPVHTIYAKFAQVVTFTFNKEVDAHIDDLEYSQNISTQSEFWDTLMLKSVIQTQTETPLQHLLDN